MTTTKSSTEMWYIEPSRQVFQELKFLVIDKIWLTYDDTYWYASSKIDYVNSLSNLAENFMIIWQMMDINNQNKVLLFASTKLKKALRERGWLLEWNLL